MRILQVNKFNYIKGGAEKSFFDINDQLDSMGHEMAVFSMHHPRNVDSPWSKYFVSHIDFNSSNPWHILRAPFRIIWSWEARRKFKKILHDFKPEIIIYHNIYHQISPSILPLARKRNIPSLLYLHDYKLICPNYRLFNRGEICEKCKGGKYYNCLRYRCLKGSWFQSLVATVEMYVHHRFLHVYEKNINLFIAPSQFMKKKVAEFGWPQAKIKVLPNFFSTYDRAQVPNNGRLLFFGRLSEEKGIDVLVQALKGTKEKLDIVGEGPERKKLEKLIIKHKLEKQVSLLGYKQDRELVRLVQEAKAVVFPSVWYENMPFTLLEALSMGKVVLVANIGGMPELIDDKKNGLLFKAGSISSLNRVIKNLNKYDLQSLQTEARKSAKQPNLYNYCKDLLQIIRKL